MAVAILEKKPEVLERTEERRVPQMNAVIGAEKTIDEQHNARISETYKKLINPTAKVDDILDRSRTAPVQPRKELFADAAIDNKPYLVENARADAEIFRADNPINRRFLGLQPVETAMDNSEEENEDLRPTQTTIQYKTKDALSTVEEDKIESANAARRESLSKKERITIAVIVSAIVAMIVLIIVNSAILSGMNNEVSYLQSSLETVKAAYSTIEEEVGNAALQAVENAEELAENLGLVK